MTTSVRKARVKNAAGAALGRTGGLENKKAGADKLSKMALKELPEETRLTHRMAAEGYSRTNILYSDRKNVRAANPARVPHLIQAVRVSRLASSFFAA